MICPACGSDQRESAKCNQCGTPLASERKPTEKEMVLDLPRFKNPRDEERTEPEAEERKTRVILETEPEPKPASRPKQELKPKQAPKPKTEPKPKIELKTEPEIKPRPAPEPEPELKLEEFGLDPEPGLKLKPEPESELEKDLEPATIESPPKAVGRDHVLTVEPGRRIAASNEGVQKVLVTTTQRIEGKKIHTYFGLISANVIIELDDPPTAPDQRPSLTNAAGRSHLKTGMLTALRDLRGEAALLGANAVIATVFNFQRVDSNSLLLSAIGTAVIIETRI